MSILKVRLIDGSYKPGNGVLELTIECLNGTPICEDAIILFETIWTISEIKKSSIYNSYDVIAICHSQFLINLHEAIKQLRGSEIACGCSWEAYQLLPSHEKIKYFIAIAELDPFRPLSKFIQDYIEPYIAIFPLGKADRPGLSKLGGLPTASQNFSYPIDKEGKPTLFIGQIHLGEFNQWFESTRKLHGQGILYFFASILIKEGTFYLFDEIHISYSEQTTNLVEIPLPDDPDIYGVFEEQSILAIEEISLPPLDSTFVVKAGLNPEQLGLYKKLEIIVENYNYASRPEEADFDSINLMGYPQRVQQCVLMEAASKNLRQGWYNPDENQREETLEMTDKFMTEALQWRHLFSFQPELFTKTSKFKGEFNQYMDGIFNVMIKKKDLDIMNFDNTESVYQFT